MTTTNVWSAVIAAVTALVVFVLTQFVTTRRDRRVRHDERARTAIREAQDAALALRNELGEFGPLARLAGGAAPTAALVAAQQRADDAFALLAVRLSRVDNAAVRASVEQWRDRARFHYVSAEEVTTAEELALWDAMNAMIGNALTTRP